MEKSSEYVGFLITLIFALGISGLFIGLHRLLGGSRPNSEKSEPFECGVRQLQAPSGRFSVQFYLVAMLFILFDVEIVWFFPWAVVLRELGWVGIAEMFFFMGVLLLGFVYAWKKGALEWER